MENVNVLDTKRTDLFMVDPRNVRVKVGHNVREDFDLESLIPSIRENGVKNPITAKREKDPETGEYIFVLTDGERRLRCALQLIEEGLELRIPCIVEKNGSTELSRYYDMLIRNIGQKPLTPIEYAKGVQHLINDMHQERKEVAKKMGVSEAQISQWLSLLQLPIEVQQKIQRGEVAAQVAQEVKKIAKSEQEQIAILDKAIEQKKVAVANSEKVSKAKAPAKVTLGDVAEINQQKNMGAFKSVFDMVFAKAEKIGDTSPFLNMLTEFYANVLDGSEIIDAIKEVDAMVVKEFKQVG